MKQTIFVILIYILYNFLFFHNVSAEEKFIERFDYSTGNLVDNPAWDNYSGTSNQIQVISNSLTYPSITSSGNKVQFSGIGYDARRSVGTEVASGILYASFLVQVSDMASFTSDGYFAGFLKSTATYGPTVWFVKDGTKIKVGLHRKSGDSPDQTFTTSYDIGTTLFIVVCYEFKTGEDEARLWINPTLGLDNEPTADLTSTAGTQMTSLEYFFLRQDANSETPQIQLDEVHVTTTWSEATLPVTLSTFTAQYLNNVPTLYWVTQSETDNIGWYIYRNTQNDFITSMIVSDLIPGYGTTTEPHSYIYEDNIENVFPGETYWYWLESIDLGGTINHYDNVANFTILVDEPDSGDNEIPEEFGLFQNKPNPFDVSKAEYTTISYSLLKPSNVELSIYNIKGELIKTIYNDFASTDNAVWDGKDENGNLQATGIYLYELKVNNKLYSTKRMILIR